MHRAAWLLHLLLAISSFTTCSPASTPLSCMAGPTTLEAMARCLRQYMLPEGSVPASQWDERNVLLDAEQAVVVRRVVHGMLQEQRKLLHNQHEQLQQLQQRGTKDSASELSASQACHSALAHADLTVDALASLGMSMQPFVDRQLQQPFCVLFETQLTDGRFSKGWGYLITPAASWPAESPASLATTPKRRLPLHIACPHPLFDGRDIDVQAVHLFKASGARTVVVSGHHRFASSRNSSCLPKYPASDPSHNAADFVNVVSYALLAYEKQAQQQQQQQRRQQRRQQLQQQQQQQQQPRMWRRVGDQCCCSCNNATGQLFSGQRGSDGNDGAAGECCCPARFPDNSCSCCCDGGGDGGPGRCCCCLGPDGSTGASDALTGHSRPSCACCEQLVRATDAVDLPVGSSTTHPELPLQPVALPHAQRPVRQRPSCLPDQPPPFVFLQLHGKAPSSCSAATAFASAGLPAGSGGSAAHNGTQAYCADEVYGPEGLAWPVQRIARALQQEFPLWRVLNPAEDPCPLVAAANVFGRVVNGVPEDKTCAQPALNLCPAAVQGSSSSNQCNGWGAFLHVEQAMEAIAADTWPGWVRALSEFT